MKTYSVVEQLTIHNECDSLIQGYINDRASTLSIEQMLDEECILKLKMLHDVLKLEIYRSIATGSICDYKLGTVVFHARRAITMSYKDNLLNPSFLM
jgi:hypothetical protein